jgi:aminoglycoside N3'-acetyltransferase
MNVIGHQTVAVHGQVIAFRSISQKRKKRSAVIIYEENIFTVVAPLSNVMSTTFDNNS